MKRYKFILLEKFLTADKIKPLYGKQAYLEIFLNPTLSELRQCPKEARGVINNKGNVYIANSPDSEDVLHVDILNFLIGKKIIKGKSFSDIKNFDDYIESFLAIQRVENSNTFRVSPSYDPFFIEMKSDIVEAYFELAKGKNKSIRFINFY